MNKIKRLNVKMAGFTLVIVLCAGLAFYGGRVYQNSADQPLFTQYSPPVAVSAGASGSYFGGGTSSSSQIQAALAYATPPGSSSSQAGGSSTRASGGQSGSGSGTQNHGSAAEQTPTTGGKTITP